MGGFLFKPYEEMTAKDYEEIGFMSGLEIHQQLLTEKKLFCRCPAGKYSHAYDAEILRHMRPTLSELGEYDGTALMEFKTKKDIIYRIHHDTVCTYEMDDTPPFQMNEDALDIAIEIGMLLDSTLVDEIHIARKQYLDGSIPTGFQRTAIVSVGGAIPYLDRKINIIQMSIEEDSCREESDIGHTRIYLADRLGMPLIETVTAPDMRTPQEVAEVNELLRRLVRTTGKVRIGAGAGREDVNVSVRGGTRIEIKGVPSIKRIPLLTYNEAMRQWNLLRLREELLSRGINSETFEAKTNDITKLLSKTCYTPIKNALAEGKVVRCVTLKGYKNLLRWQTQTDTYFSKEISDRVRVIACLNQLPNIIHSDSHENTLSTAEGLKIRKFVGAGEEDTLVIVWGDERDANTGAKEIIIRAKEAAIGIPSETRQALRDGTNGFERILPGPERMYPDTDLPPKQITAERLETIRQQVPPQPWKLTKWYAELGLAPEIAKELSHSKKSLVFEKAVKEIGVEPKLAASVLIPFPKRLKKKGLDTGLLCEEIYIAVFNAIKSGAVPKDYVLYFMADAIRLGGFSEQLLKKPATEAEIKAEIAQAAELVKNSKIHNPENIAGFIMGETMKNLRGKAVAAAVNILIREIK